MTTMTLPERAEPARGRTVELVLAHMHLRLGSLALARVELETLAGLGGLDTIGMVDLAEVRWRTGDLLGAGEAAAAGLSSGSDDPIALVIAAEAASSLGRPSEARRLANRAISRAPGTIDALFAGMPRSNVWAPDANEPAPTAPTLFDRGPEIPSVSHAGDPSAAPAAAAQAAAKPAAPVNLGFWDADEGSAGEVVGDLDPALEFEAGRTALIAGAVDEAAFRFGLALRLAPAFAPAVLEATEGARAANLTIVRGDAYRLAGHEPEARQAYAVAANGGLPERRARVRPRLRPKATVVADDEAVEQPPLIDASMAGDADAVHVEDPGATGTEDVAEAVVADPDDAAEPDAVAEAEPDAAAAVTDAVAEAEPDAAADPPDVEPSPDAPPA
jgi:tetratricopeptide (TPR) repeat protein